MNIRLLKLYRQRFVFDWQKAGLWKVVDKKYKRKEFCEDELSTFIENRANELGWFAVRKYNKKRAKGKKLIEYYSALHGIEMRKSLGIQL